MGFKKVNFLSNFNLSYSILQGNCLKIFKHYSKAMSITNAPTHQRTNAGSPFFPYLIDSFWYTFLLFLLLFQAANQFIVTFYRTYVQLMELSRPYLDAINLPLTTHEL